ncbi:expressed unknown protein [Seminavis robusta]|uniref:Uncharacterized protein n=1 Tax=Seminavis robusta TaxID=568900 RepID=A0A9N8HB14_9STRA|nr:expressed unknown protein [Seminavis robusta]|eukprot:Sro261_g101900.1 n/a (657) ;mRNA; f:78423-80393
MTASDTTTSSNKRCLDALTIEELEEELRKRRKKAAEEEEKEEEELDDDCEDVPIYHWPDASSINLHVARARLSAIFQAIEDNCSDVTADYDFDTKLHALFLLRSHQSLIAEAYNRRTTLSYFLQAGTDATTMEELALMYNAYVPENPKMEFWMYSFPQEPNIVADLCKYGALKGGCEGNSRVIMKQFSHQILKPIIPTGATWCRKTLPFDLLVKTCIPRTRGDRDHIFSEVQVQLKVAEILESMLEFSPNMFNEIRNEDSIFFFLTGRHIGNILKQFVFEKLAQHWNVTRLVIPTWMRYFDAQDAYAIGRMLPKLKTFRYLNEIGTNTFETLLNVLFCQRDTTMLEDLGLSIPNWEISEWQPMFGATIKKYTNLRRMALCMARPPRDENYVFDLHFFETAQRNHKGISELELEGFRLYSTASLNKVMHNNLESLVLDDVTVTPDQPWSSDSTPFPSLTDVRLDNIDASQLWVQGLLMQLAKSPELTSLNVNHFDEDGDEADLTNVFIAFLKANRLSCLQGSCFSLDLNKASQALSQNTSLNYFALPYSTPSDQIGKLGEALESNKTLSHIDTRLCLVDSDEGSKVVHYSILNLFNREALSDPKKATKEEVLRQLSDVLDCLGLGDDDRGFGEEHSDLVFQSARFAILQMTSSVWAK